MQVLFDTYVPVSKYDHVMQLSINWFGRPWFCFFANHMVQHAKTCHPNPKTLFSFVHQFSHVSSTPFAHFFCQNLSSNWVAAYWKHHVCAALLNAAKSILCATLAESCPTKDSSSQEQVQSTNIIIDIYMALTFICKNHRCLGSPWCPVCAAWMDLGGSSWDRSATQQLGGAARSLCLLLLPKAQATRQLWRRPSEGAE